MSDGTKVSGFLFLPRDGDPSASSPSVDRSPSSEGSLVMPPPGGHSEDTSLLVGRKSHSSKGDHDFSPNGEVPEISPSVGREPPPSIGGQNKTLSGTNGCEGVSDEVEEEVDKGRPKFKAG